MPGIVAALTCGFSRIDTVLGKVHGVHKNSVCFPTSAPLRYTIRIPTNQKVSCSMIWSIAPGTGLKCSEHSVLSWHMITDHWIDLPMRAEMPPSGISDEGSVPADVQVSRFGRDRGPCPWFICPWRLRCHQVELATRVVSRLMPRCAFDMWQRPCLVVSVRWK